MDPGLDFASWLAQNRCRRRTSTTTDGTSVIAAAALPATFVGWPVGLLD